MGPIVVRGAYPGDVPNRPLVIAHRGASGYRPEHTMAAYRLAIALGADAIEPDLVATRDGVLVLRHENEISGTTDIASRPEFASRRTTKRIDGTELTGWFTEDFDWAELATLRATERIPEVRGASATHGGREPMLRLRDLVDLLASTPTARGRLPLLVAELKHATHFDAVGHPLDELLVRELDGRLDPDRVIVESFEQTVLDRLADRGIAGRRIFLAERSGSPADLVARLGRAALPYSAHLTDAGLGRLARAVDGVSVDVRLILEQDARGRVTGTSDLVDRAHAAGLEVYTWTLRPENRFLPRSLRVGDDPAAWGRWDEAFSLVLGTGVDGVFTDHPDLVLELLD